MDYERRYKLALERAKKLYGQGAITESLGFVFPELRECEDERVRKWLEELIEAMPDNSIEFKELKRIDVLHWLEKQSKKKSADEVIKIRRELYQSGYNDGYKHGQMDYAYNLNREAASSVKLDADNMWLQNYISNVTCLVNQFSNSSNIGKDLKGGEE